MRIKKNTEKHGVVHIKGYFTTNIFETWKEAKTMAGYKHSTNSEFVAHLLSLEFCRR